MSNNQSDRGTVNELRMGYYLNNNRWFSHEAHKIFVEKVLKLDPAEFKIEDARSHAQADAALDWARQHGYRTPLKKVYWVAKRGVLTQVTGVDIKEGTNPTDILLEFAGGPGGKFESFLGVSAKSTISRVRITFKNPGLGTVEKDLNIQLYPIVEKFTKEAIKAGAPEDRQKRKNAYNTNRKIKAILQELGDEAFLTVRDRIMKRLLDMSNGELRTYFMTNWMDATEIFPPYIRVTGLGDKEPFRAKVEDPLKNETISLLTRGRITLEKEGYTSIRINANGKRVMRIRAKWESTPLSSPFKFSASS